MATTFKTLGAGDVTTTRTLLHESIPITGSIVSGTYGGDAVALGSEGHIKTYSHGMFQSVYDYPYLSSSANHILLAMLLRLPSLGQAAHKMLRKLTSTTRWPRFSWAMMKRALFVFLTRTAILLLAALSLKSATL